MAINWDSEITPDKSSSGHSPVRYGSGPNRGYAASTSPVRSYVRCECGALLSGRGDQAVASWRRHQQRELKKAEQARTLAARLAQGPDSETA